MSSVSENTCGFPELMIKGIQKKKPFLKFGVSLLRNSYQASPLMDSGDLISCEICLEAFDSQCRPPKIIPCGHNFCENCLFSLCLHSEYYLLDTIKCPKCRQLCDAKLAMNAPTNYDLCKVLENFRYTQNVTVIHVPDHSSSSLANKERKRKLKRCQGSKNKMTEACFDCRRSINKVERSVICRFCKDCHETAKTLRLVCLECCVNSHNGHRLVQIEQLERNHQDVMKQTAVIQKHTDYLDKDFKQRAKNLNENNGNLQKLEILRDSVKGQMNTVIKKNMARLEQEYPLSPAELTAIHRNQMELAINLQKMANVFNKISSNSEEMNIQFEQKLVLSSMDLMTALVKSEEMEDLRQYLVLLYSDNIQKETRFEILYNCVRIMHKALNNQINNEIFVLLEDLTFKTLVFLNKLFPRGMVQDKNRMESWRLATETFGKIMEISNVRWTSYDEWRVDFVSDLSFLCQLFADVCDSGTITLCTIETARSRVVLNSHKSDKALINKIKFAEQCLLECRRIQKLMNICVKSKRYPNGDKCRGLKQWLNCLGPKVL
ncbi:unnamed protein product [Bursaphelenchus xylophilus]|uniref:(pine wood nematode) hypothetical protein n=1 Tax=Bursaphelenchus xylophilus TaxID=6326 RepID=A0A1I7S319_BURXY|nr:unnamed protein product [Bursaphelenchus xylophilus]CAG9116066.1 unnamed protein product [Bursaphelenchus xylophilus]